MIDLSQKLGGNVPLGSIVTMDDREPLINDPSGAVLLKSGSVLTDVANYPNYPIKYSNSGTQYEIDPTNDIVASTIGGGYLWFVTSTNLIRRHNLDGTYAGVQFTAAKAGTITEIVYIGGALYAQHSVTGRPIVEYGLTSGAIVSEFDIGGADDLKGLGSDGTDLYTITSDDQLKVYSVAGSLLSTTPLAASYDKLVYDGQYFLTIRNTEYVYLTTGGDEVLKNGHMKWRSSPLAASTFLYNDTDDTIVICSGNDGYVFVQSIFGGLLPQLTAGTPVGVIYWRIK